MVSAVLTSLSLVFVAAGMTLLLTSMALSRRARRYRRGMQTLLQLGNQNLEPLAVPAEVWPVLAQAGWAGLSLGGQWYGHTVAVQLGAMPDTPAVEPLGSGLAVQIDSGNDVRLTLKLMHSASRGEERLFAEQLARVFVLLLETSVRVRTEALSVALAERARLSLYLQHDMRNLAQWVGWVCSDFAACDDAAALQAAASRLQENAPLAQERAHRLIAALGKQPVTDNPRQIDLGLAINKAAHMAGIELELSGQAQGWIARGLLARALDNLFSNLAAAWRESPALRPVVQLRTVGPTDAASAMAEIDFFSAWPPDTSRLAPDKLFEPFASGRPGGLGLGLYQARKSLNEAGGELQAQPNDTGLRFVLRIPAKAP